MVDVQSLSVHELLQHDVDVLAELKRREIVRTGNNPVGDYAEQLVAKQLNLTLSANSTEGYDATDPVTGLCYQIKACRPPSREPVAPAQSDSEVACSALRPSHRGDLQY